MSNINFDGETITGSNCLVMSLKLEKTKRPLRRPAQAGREAPAPNISTNLDT